MIFTKRLSLSLRIFLIIALLILFPFSLMLQYVKSDMEAVLREEISLKVVQNISKSENEISQVLGRMISISNVFFRDPDFARTFNDEDQSYYDRAVVFNNVLNEISMQNLYDSFLENTHVTFFDREKQTYANWSLNNKDIAYILDQDWVKDSISAKGYILWKLSTDGFEFLDEKPGKHISLARSIMNDDHSDKRLGTIILSIDHEYVFSILNKYKYSDLDSICALTQEGAVLFNNNEFLSEEELTQLLTAYNGEREGNDIIAQKGRRYLLSYYTISLSSIYSQKQLKIFYFTDYQNIQNQMNNLLIKINTLSLIFIAVLFIIAIFIARWIARPIRVLSGLMKRYRVGEQPVALEVGRKDEIGDIYQSFYTMSSHINDLFKRLTQEQRIKEKYQFESLRSKMSPHFLFNTLNTIRWMAIIRKADNIRESIDALAEILKYSMTKNDELVPLDQEISIIKSYCHIQNMRFGNSYTLEVDLEDSVKDLLIIKFILQPVVENIFKHAFSPDTRGGLIHIGAWRDNDRLLVTISDNGKGFSKESIEIFYQRREGSGNAREHLGIGLDIIDERIRIAFGKEYGIELSNGETGGARVDYHLPIKCMNKEAGGEA